MRWQGVVYAPARGSTQQREAAPALPPILPAPMELSRGISARPTLLVTSPNRRLQFKVASVLHAASSVFAATLVVFLARVSHFITSSLSVLVQQLSR